MQPPPQVDPTLTGVSNFGISMEGWLTLLAIVLGPIIALWVQRISDRRREARQRKLWVFRELMATRTARLSQRHVEALNLIDLEFDPRRKKDEKVLAAWRQYLDNLANTPRSEEYQAAHFQQRHNLFNDLLYEIGRYLGFSFDKVAISRNAYMPVAHGEIEDDQRLIRKGIVELLTGKRALSTLSWLMPPQQPYPIIQVTEPPAVTVPQAQLAEPPAQRQPLLEESAQAVPRSGSNEPST